MEPVRIFSTRPDAGSKSTPVDRFLTGPVDRFFTQGFCSLFNVLMKNFQKGGSMGKGLKFVTSDGVLKKNAKKFFVFYKNNLISRPFLVKFRFERSVLSSAQHAQNKHKKIWRAQAKSRAANTKLL